MTVLLVPFSALSTLLQDILIQMSRFMANVPPLAAVGSFGLAIVLLTLAVRIALYPLYRLQMLNSRRMQIRNAEMQPKMQELRKKHRNDFKQLQAETQKIQKEHNMSPGTTGLGCLLGILPLAITYPFYFAIKNAALSKLLPSPHFLWISDAAESVRAACCSAKGQSFIDVFAHPQLLILLVLAGGMTFVQGRMMVPPPALNTTEQMQTMSTLSKRMTMIIPLTIAVAGYTLPQGLAIYWVTQYSVIIIHQYYLLGAQNLPRWAPGANWRGRLHPQLHSVAQEFGKDWSDYFSREARATQPVVATAAGKSGASGRASAANGSSAAASRRRPAGAAPTTSSTRPTVVPSGENPRTTRPQSRRNNRKRR